MAGGVFESRNGARNAIVPGVVLDDARHHELVSGTARRAARMSRCYDSACLD
jgi:hypothetical protein